MSALAEFLLARIAEDERLAELTPMGPRRGHPTGSYVGTRWMNFRMTILAECEAKRRIVELSTRWIGGAQGYQDGVREGVHAALRLLALPYADHPDYRQEWRP